MMLYEENAMEERERLCAKYGLGTISPMFKLHAPNKIK